ncbi:MAG: GerAB/ArcD/ProY family transporter [Oscillospiraceae bacterium]|nr:GerAB/ArcD/ProY family transporter [Oscillospiraceae bacterium]
MTAKISTGQFLCLLLICRIFDLMTFVPLVSEGYSFGEQAAAAVISTVIQAVLVIPLIIFERRFPERTVTAVIAEKNLFAGKTASALYFVFFLVSALSGTVSFMRFLESRFFHGTGDFLMPVIFIAVCVYCAYCGIEGIARSSIFVLVFFILIMALMTASSVGNFSTVNFYGSINGKGLADAVISDLARNSFITAAAFLIKNTDRSCRKGLYGLLGAKLIITELVMLMITGILGGYAQLTDYPFMEVGSYSEARLFQRNDALYLIVWTLAAVVTVSLFIRITAGLAKEIFPKIRFGLPVTGVIVFTAAWLMLKYNARLGSGADIVISGCTVLLTGIIPGTVCILKGRKGEKIEKA